MMQKKEKVLTVVLWRQITTNRGQCFAVHIKEGAVMPKKEVRVTIIGSQRRKLDVDAMTQVVIALGREFAQRKRGKREPKPISRAEVGS